MVDAELTDLEIWNLTVSYPFSAYKQQMRALTRTERQVATAATRKALWWAVGWLTNRSWHRESDALVKQLRELGIAPWPQEASAQERQPGPEAGEETDGNDEEPGPSQRPVSERRSDN